MCQAQGVFVHTCACVMVDCCVQHGSKTQTVFRQLEVVIVPLEVLARHTMDVRSGIVLSLLWLLRACASWCESREGWVAREHSSTGLSFHTAGVSLSQLVLTAVLVSMAGLV